jgi:hypothetical protein
MTDKYRTFQDLESRHHGNDICQVRLMKIVKTLRIFTVIQTEYYQNISLEHWL